VHVHATRAGRLISPRGEPAAHFKQDVQILFLSLQIVTDLLMHPDRDVHCKVIHTLTSSHDVVQQIEQLSGRDDCRDLSHKILNNCQETSLNTAPQFSDIMRLMDCMRLG